jgi:hypothetical protein
VILTVVAPARLVVGRTATFTVVFRAPAANVVAVVQTTEDVDGSRLRLTSRQRRVGVIAQAFGREDGQLPITVSFDHAGRTRLTFVLVTDDGDESDPWSLEGDVGG